MIKAIEADVLAQYEVNLRGTSGAAALEELIEAGMPEEAAKDVLAAVAECESARFSPSDVAVAPLRDLWKRAKQALG